MKTILNCKSQQGFTLIELMIVIVIIAILVAIAFPSYQDSVRKSRRADAEKSLVQTANEMERFYTEKNTYVGATWPANVTSDFYTFSITVQSASAYTLQADPAGTAQAADSCGILTLTHTGVKGAATTGCW